MPLLIFLSFSSAALPTVHRHRPYSLDTQHRRHSNRRRQQRFRLSWIAIEINKGGQRLVGTKPLSFGYCYCCRRYIQLGGRSVGWWRRAQTTHQHCRELSVDVWHTHFSFPPFRAHGPLLQALLLTPLPTSFLDSFWPRSPKPNDEKRNSLTAVGDGFLELDFEKSPKIRWNKGWSKRRWLQFFFVFSVASQPWRVSELFGLIGATTPIKRRPPRFVFIFLISYFLSVRLVVCRQVEDKHWQASKIQ